MRTQFWPTAILLLLAVPVFGGDFSRELSAEPIALSNEAVHVVFKAGEMLIRGTDGSRLEVKLKATCRKPKPRCLRALEDLRIVSEAYNGDIELKFEGVTKRRARRMDFEVLLEIPESTVLAVKMGLGSLEIENLREDLAVDMWMGELTVRMAEADVHSVLTDTGIGDASITAPSNGVDGHRSALVGAEAKWLRGAGSARVDLDLQIGDISVRLE